MLSFIFLILLDKIVLLFPLDMYFPQKVQILRRDTAAR